MLHRPSQKQYVFISMASVLVVVGLFFGMSACSDSQAKPKLNYIFKDTAPKPGVMVKIGDEEITEEQLIGDDKMEYYELKKKEYEFRLDRLNRLVLEKLAGAEAKKANLSLEEYLEKKIIGGKVKVSNSEFDKFIKDKKIPKEQVTELKDRIMGYLEATKKQELVQAYVAKLTKSTPVEVYFKKPEPAVINVDPGQGPSFGKKGAKVTIVEFSDFQCPFCSRGAEVVSQLKKKYGSKVFFTFRHFPLPMHPQARPASEASMCVFEQGEDKFWKFHDLAFQHQDKLGDADLEGYAKTSGANVDKFKECYSSKKYAQAVKDDTAYGEKIGVRSTPTFFINGQLVAGALPIEHFEEIINEQLDKK